MNKYLQNKEKARNSAIDWQIKASNENLSYSELIQASKYFTRLGRRYGLLSEFKENGII